MIDLLDIEPLDEDEQHLALMARAHALIEAVREWANSDCSPTAAEQILQRLAEFDQRRIG